LIRRARPTPTCSPDGERPIHFFYSFVDRWVAIASMDFFHWPSFFFRLISPALLANLWDVTDKDIDKLALDLFVKTGLQSDEQGPNGSSSSMTLTGALASARSSCQLKYLNGTVLFISFFFFNSSRVFPCCFRSQVKLTLRLRISTCITRRCCAHHIWYPGQIPSQKIRTPSRPISKSLNWCPQQTWPVSYTSAFFFACMHHLHLAGFSNLIIYIFLAYLWWLYKT
jgi:hypothetical protein